MASTSPKAGYTLLPRTSEENERKAQDVDPSNRINSLGLPLDVILRLLATGLSITAIITNSIGDDRYWGSRSNGMIAFPLVFLSISTLTHIILAIIYLSSKVHVEWKGPNWQGPRPCSYGRFEPAKKPPRYVIAAADLAAGTLMAVGITLCSLATYWPIPIGVVGIVFTSLTAATHIFLGVVRTEQYGLTLLYSPYTHVATHELVRSPLVYQDLEDTSEQQPIISTMNV